MKNIQSRKQADRLAVGSIIADATQPSWPVYAKKVAETQWEFPSGYIAETADLFPSPTPLEVRYSA